MNTATYKCYKIKLKNIINDKSDILELENICKYHNEYVTHVYQFLRLYVLSKYHKNEDIPVIDFNFISSIFKCLSSSNAGPKVSGEHLTTLNDLKTFYDSNYKNLCADLKINSARQSQMINYSIVDMVTNFENNIKLNFEKYVRFFINSVFLEEILKKIENNDEKIITTKLLKKQLYGELKKFKDDVINNKKIDEKYEIWFRNNKSKILPNSYNGIGDVEINTLSYVKPMIFMNVELEKLNKKMFQWCPQRNGFNLKYVCFDTKGIVEALVNKTNSIITKTTYYNNIIKYKNVLWSKFFNLKHKIFKNKKYVFDNSIMTDGVIVSLRFIDIETFKKKEIEDIKTIHKQNAIRMMKYFKKNFTPEQYKLHVEVNEFLKKEDETRDKLKKQQDLKEHIIKIKNDPSLIVKEFKYIDDLKDEELNNIKNNYIVIDPGKRTILQMFNHTKDKILTYTSRQRTFEKKSLKFTRKLLNNKKNKKIIEKETSLSEYSCKTCDIEKYKSFIKCKYENYKELQNFYELSKSRLYRWYLFLNTKRSEDKLINNIKKTFGKKVNILIGDWSNGKTQMKNFKSTPRIGLKRKLKKHFNVYNLDEFKTSSMCYKTYEETENLTLYNTKKKLNIKKGHKNKKISNIKINAEMIKKCKILSNKKIKKISEYKKQNKNISKQKPENPKPKENIKKYLHAVLSYKMKNKRTECKNECLGFINRDKNSCYNMINIVESYLLDKTRPIYLSRSNKDN